MTFKMKMKNYLHLKWELILLIQLKLTAISHGSIAGVTYMDNFDFEDRYRSVYECDPFHWHPLHLPEYCAEMYANLISSRIAKHRPVRVVREREQPEPVIYSINPSFGYPTYGIPSYVYEPPDVEVMKAFEYERPPLSPYDKMLELLRRDVEINPSAPSIGIMPNVGPVAVYRQPISRKSKKMIKKISGAYARAGRQNHGGEYYGKIEVKGPPRQEVETAADLGYGSKKRKKIKSSVNLPKIISLEG